MVKIDKIHSLEEYFPKSMSAKAKSDRGKSYNNWTNRQTKGQTNRQSNRQLKFIILWIQEKIKPDSIFGCCQS